MEEKNMNKDSTGKFKMLYLFIAMIIGGFVGTLVGLFTPFVTAISLVVGVLTGAILIGGFWYVKSR